MTLDVGKPCRYCCRSWTKTTTKSSRKPRTTSSITNHPIAHIVSAFLCFDSSHISYSPTLHQPEMASTCLPSWTNSCVLPAMSKVLHSSMLGDCFFVFFPPGGGGGFFPFLFLFSSAFRRSFFTNCCFFFFIFFFIFFFLFLFFFSFFFHVTFSTFFFSFLLSFLAGKNKG